MAGRPLRRARQALRSRLNPVIPYSPPRTKKQLMREAKRLARVSVFEPLGRGVSPQTAAYLTLEEEGFEEGTRVLAQAVASGRKPLALLYLVWPPYSVEPKGQSNLTAWMQEALRQLRALPQVPGLQLVPDFSQERVLFGHPEHIEAFQEGMRWHKERSWPEAVALIGLSLGYPPEKIAAFIRPNWEARPDLPWRP